ncbi:MAG: sigma-70 family RNA polymerase sigma factor [Actinobacteria bacterium]|nr:sigma-70 family RNA polymerase sigma factor [Actinomycetota bacterium]
MSTDALEQIYRQQFPAFLRVATAISGDTEGGKDAVQAAFVSAVRNIRSFRGEGTIEAWVWAIVLREARKVRASHDVPLEEVSELGHTNGAVGDGPEGVRSLLAALPPRQREAVFLRYFADLDYRSIARVLGVEPGTVSATLSAAHQTMRKRLEATAR